MVSKAVLSPNPQTELEATEDRKKILLRAAYDLLKRSTQGYYVREATSILTRFDGADCDGQCLMSDIATELGLEEDTEPIPLGDLPDAGDVSKLDIGPAPVPSVGDSAGIKPGASENPACGCLRCIRERGTKINGLPEELTRMIVCQSCGNKRCPRASDHRHACTRSNEPGQQGSSHASGTPDQERRQEP
jgi:hypothetical protein